MKHHGGCAKADLTKEGLDTLEKGLPNLLNHIENVTKVFNLPAVVAINRFPQDTVTELELIRSQCKKYGANIALSEVWAKGSEGGIELAKEVIRLAEDVKPLNFTYPDEAPVKDKLLAIAQRIYGADNVIFTENASAQIKKIENMGFGKLPVCVAKTQYSFSDDPVKLGCPKGFNITVKNIKISAGAGFIVALTGDIMTMPGLPKVPSAQTIDIDENGKISGLF